MLTLNKVLDHIKANLGMSHRQVELDDNAMIQCILEESLPEFSIYFPYYCQYRLDTSSENKVYGSDNIFFIPEVIEDFNVISVQSAISGGLASGSNNLGTGNISALGSDPQAALMALIGQKMASTMSSNGGFSAESFTFLPPNMIRLNANIGNNPLLILRTTHRRDLTTIPHGAIGHFKMLAYYDVARDIYSIRRYFSNVQTIFAQIQLNMDELSNVNDKRIELIERFRKEQLKFSTTKKIYIA